MIESTLIASCDASLFSPTGKEPTEYYGTYLLRLIGNSLIVGLSNSPGNEDGAVLYRYDDSTWTLESVLDEQGVVDLLPVGDEWYVPGLDPFDDWSLGNIYKRSALGAWTKIRTLPNTIHCFQLAHDGTYLYAAVGAHAGDNATWRGQVLRSADGGQTWPHISTLCDYRCYHAYCFAGRIYASQADIGGHIS